MPPALTNAVDAVSDIVGQWGRERPDLDPTPLLVFSRLFRAAAAGDAALRPPFAEVGLASGDFDVLAALRRQGAPYAASPSQLAAATLVTQGATTKRVDRLHASGFVTRMSPERDRRVRKVRLTPRGLRLVDRLVGMHLENEAQLLEGFTATERAVLADLLLRLTEAAQASTAGKGTERR